MGMGKILWGWEGDEIMGTRWDVENPRESGRDGEKFMEMGGDGDTFGDSRVLSRISRQGV